MHAFSACVNGKWQISFEQNCHFPYMHGFSSLCCFLEIVVFGNRCIPYVCNKYVRHQAAGIYNITWPAKKIAAQNLGLNQSASTAISAKKRTPKNNY
jgi:hypothetical protein